MEYNNLLVDKKESVGIVTINRPSTLNALNTETLIELNHVINEMDKNDEIYVMVITGAGKAFVVGADITEMKELSPENARRFGQLGSEIFRTIELIKKPIIAAVNGFALGGGCELAMSCDIRIAGERARFGQPEVGLGIIPGFGGTQRLPRLVGIAKAKELIFSAKIIDAIEAEKIGLVNEVVSQTEVLNEAVKLAQMIASKGQIAVRYSKSAINRGIETDVDTGMIIEENLFGLCFANEDQKEAMIAFIEKRPTKFKNKI